MNEKLNWKLRRHKWPWLSYPKGTLHDLLFFLLKHFCNSFHYLHERATILIHFSVTDSWHAASTEARWWKYNKDYYREISGAITQFLQLTHNSTRESWFYSFSGSTHNSITLDYWSTIAITKAHTLYRHCRALDWSTTAKFAAPRPELSTILQLALQPLQNLRLCLRFAQHQTAAAQRCRRQQHRNCLRGALPTAPGPDLVPRQRALAHAHEWRRGTPRRQPCQRRRQRPAKGRRRHEGASGREGVGAVRGRRRQRREGKVPTLRRGRCWREEVAWGGGFHLIRSF
jgi:hypothetical protein